MTEPFLTSHAPSPAHPSETPPGPSAAERAGPGTIVGGRYTLRAAVGTGGMGTVWQATDTQLGRSVAVKEVVPPPGIAPEDREAMYQRMLREARAAAGLSHPAIVQVYDVVTDGGRPWVVMELLEARSLSEVILQDGPLAPRAVAKIGVALLGALEVAHAAGVLHRDVKPANVLVCTDGRCVLTDFGVARMPTDQQLTTPGMVLGSPHFISPERAMGAPFGPPSDLFSLGVSLYAAVEGRPPFDKGEPIATMHSVVEDEPPPPERAGPLTDVLYGLLEKDPHRRWDAARARGTLRDLLAGPLTTTTPQFPTDPYAVVPTQRRPWQQADADRIGGRALLAPGEDPVARHRDPAPGSPAAGSPGRHNPGPDSAGPHSAADATAGDSTMLLPQSGGPRDPYAAVSDPYRRVPDSYQVSPAPAGPPGPRSAPPAPPGGSDPPAAGRRAGASAGTAATLRATAGQAARTASAQLARAGRAVAGTVTRAPRRVQVAAVAGLVAVLLIGVVWAAGSGDDDPAEVAGGEVPAPDPTGGPPPDQPLLDEVREYSGRGMVVNLPAQWAGVDNPDLVYVDFVDPADASSRVRLLREDSRGEPVRFVEVAEQNIRDSAGCPAPYQRLELRELELTGQPAAMLEYTCGEGDEMTHSKWATVIHDGSAYSFRLTTREDEFAGHAVIFDELVRSFRLAS